MARGGGGGGGGGMEEKLEILKKILGLPQKLYAFSKPPLMHFILFKDPPPLLYRLKI
jgi:hypothetical protein